jgi:hypothetical protein
LQIFLIFVKTHKNAWLYKTISGAEIFLAVFNGQSIRIGSNTFTFGTAEAYHFPELFCKRWHFGQQDKYLASGLPWIFVDWDN